MRLVLHITTPDGICHRVEHDADDAAAAMREVLPTFPRGSKTTRPRPLVEHAAVVLNGLRVQREASAFVGQR